MTRDTVARVGLVVLAAASGLLVVAATSKYGIGLDSDSVLYIQVAREMLAGRGVPNSYILQPPLYPLLLALGGALTFSDPLAFAVWFHALVFGALVFCAGAILVREMPQLPILALLGVFGIVLARPLVGVALTAFSELAFIFFELVTLFAFAQFLKSEHARWLALAIAATALACLTRYIGVSLLVTGALALLFLWRAAWRKKIFYAAGFALLAALPLALWALRNISISGEPFGARGASRFTLQQNITLTARAFANWFAPEDWAWVVYGAVLVVAVGWLVHASGARKIFAKDSAFAALCALFCIVYVFVLVGTATTTAYNRIGSRLASPLFVPAWMLFIITLARALENVKQEHYKRAVRVAVYGFVALILVFSLQTTWTRVSNALREGAGGYNSMEWRESETLRFVKNNLAALPEPRYSNSTDALYILGEMASQNVLPKFQHSSRARAFSADELRGVFPPVSSTLIWFTRAEGNDFVFSLQEIKEFTKLTLLEQFADGAVYRMDKK